MNIHIVPSKDHERRHLSGSIKSVWKYFSIEEYKLANQSEQKKLVLRLITDCFLDVSEEIGWNKNNILNAKERALHHNCEFHFRSVPIKSRSKELSACIELELSRRKLSIWILFSTSDKQEWIKKHLIDTNAENLSFFRFFDKPCWLNQESFGFQFNNGVTLGVSLDDATCCWRGDDPRFVESFKYQLEYNEDWSPELAAKLANW